MILKHVIILVLNPIKITKSQYVSTCLPTIDHIDPPWYATEIHWGKGFLAADESGGPWLRARHAEAAKIPDTGPHWAVDPGLSALTKNPSWTIWK